MARSWKNPILLDRWFEFLGLQHHASPNWYRSRIREELQERRTAKYLHQKISETSDVLFSIHRACHDGIPCRQPPRKPHRCIPIYTYMLPKYTLRWKFFQITAFLSGCPHYKNVREVVNPCKDENLRIVAQRHDIDPERFAVTGRRLRNVWPLLP